MVDTIRKILEQVVAERLRKQFWGKYTLSTDQYGFQVGCSTIDTAEQLK